VKALRPRRCAIALVLLLAGRPALAAPPAVQWRQSLAGWGQPAVDEQTAFVLTRHHEIAALDVATGAVRWRAYTGGPGDTPLGSAVRLAGSHVIVGDEAIAAFDRTSGRQAWRFVPRQGRGAGIFLGDAGHGLVLAGSVSGDLYAIDAATGAQRWTRRLRRPLTTAVYPPVVAAGRIVVAFTGFDRRLSGGVAAFDLQGTRLWMRRLPAGVGTTGAVTIDGTTAIVGTTDGAIRAYAIADGSARWSLPRRRGLEPRGRDIRALARSGRVLVAGSLSTRGGNAGPTPTGRTAPPRCASPRTAYTCTRLTPTAHSSPSRSRPGVSAGVPHHRPIRSNGRRSRTAAGWWRPAVPRSWRSTGKGTGRSAACLQTGRNDEAR
jgi:outer membrane protein assembly factor BamB